jgi:hypothetical protein
MSSVIKLEAQGFTFTPAPVGINLTRVWCKRPFRYWNTRFVASDEILAKAELALKDATGIGFSFTLTNYGWSRDPNMDFPFNFLFEVDFQTLEAMQHELDALDKRIKKLQDLRVSEIDSLLMWRQKYTV